MRRLGNDADPFKCEEVLEISDAHRADDVTKNARTMRGSVRTRSIHIRPSVGYTDFPCWGCRTAGSGRTSLATREEGNS